MYRNSSPGYRLTITKVKLEGGEVVSYGLEVFEGQDILKIPDISPDRAKVSEMVKLFNDMHLSAEHVYDVIEDMLP